MFMFRLSALIVLVLLIMAAPARAQEVANGRSITVFLDCDHRCDSEYIRQEIDFVNYMRDRNDAQVHLLITQQQTGSGRIYTLNFIGRQEFAALSDTLYFSTSDTDTDDERRAGMARVIKLGLVRYVARTPQAGLVVIDYKGQGVGQEQQTTPENDPWNFWVFRLGVNGSVEAEESANEFDLGGNLNTSRVTEDWKIRLGAFGRYREQNFEIDDSTITSTNRNGDLYASVIRSIGEHWGIGAFSRMSTSSFNNTDLSGSVKGAIEYNIFPYSESTRREFRISYSLGLQAFDYEELTLFDKKSEALVQHELEARLSFQQPWGEAFASLQGSNYLYGFTDGETKFDFYSVSLDGFVSMRLFRGLSVFVNGEIEWIKDQLYLPAEDASEEDILLRNRRLPTSYQFDVRIGLNYTFGSIYNNIVNARFGD